MIKSTVIITAYNRTQYLYDALNSVIKQDNNNLFQIIVAYNFEDSKIDKLMFENKNIEKLQYSNESIGYILAKSIELSQGDIIFFLDDDDEFCINKVEFIQSKFEYDPNLIYYHNASLGIDEEGNFSNSRMFLSPKKPLIINTSDLSRTLKTIKKFDSFFNLSSIVVRKKIIQNNLNFLSEIKTNPDNFMFYCAITNKGNIYIDNVKLTKYRIHESTTQSSNVNEYAKKLILYYKNSLDSLNKMKLISSKKILKNEIFCSQIRCKINLTFLTDDKYDIKISELLLFCRCNYLKHEIRPSYLVLIYIMYTINKPLAKSVYNKYKFKFKNT